ncbi:unnamed protein product [Lactuca saligna]|uniref:GRF-type domain-containing protein n=1 Tax=Lactuca saligna TaxID=75948 RepID=A0AA35URU0_LACSI|nr:unnamed protein product [Lactuca saligna]
MSSTSSTSRNQLQVTHVQSQEGVKVCDCGIPAKERTCWKITNRGRRFWNCQKSMTRLRKCSFFEWKDEEQADGYYKNLLYSLKQKLDAKDELSEMNKLRRIAEVKFLLSQEQYKVAKSEKEVHDARKAIGRYRMIVALLFACLALCVLKLGGVNVVSWLVSLVLVISWGY